MKQKSSSPLLRPDKVVPKLPAQFTGLSQACKEILSVKTPFLAQLAIRTDIGYMDKAVIELLYLYGLRIQEVLNIQAPDVESSGIIRISGLKGSRDRFVSSVLFRHHWIDHWKFYLPLSQYYNRFYFYRLFKKLGYYSRFCGNVNFSVTHFFRHKIVNDLRAQGYTKEMLTEFLGHRSGKSIEHYVD